MALSLALCQADPLVQRLVFEADQAQEGLLSRPPERVSLQQPRCTHAQLLCHLLGRRSEWDALPPQIRKRPDFHRHAVTGRGPRPEGKQAVGNRGPRGRAAAELSRRRLQRPHPAAAATAGGAAVRAAQPGAGGLAAAVLRRPRAHATPDGRPARQSRRRRNPRQHGKACVCTSGPADCGLRRIIRVGDGLDLEGRVVGHSAEGSKLRAHPGRLHGRS
mmetsp:Transcript_16951/g.59257  ORF Transcript_16951/g.59257 Transcript_16951/m.59257 type:complete len:218 (-) Transcript_16951:52-705(-)